MFEEKFDPVVNLEFIRGMTHDPKIIPLKSLTSFLANEAIYECVRGSFTGINLLHKDKKVAVQIAKMEQDTIAQAHTHINNVEYAIVVEGEVFSRVGETVKNAKVGECVVVNPGETHVVFCHVPTTMICITIPASEGYPNE